MAARAYTRRFLDGGLTAAGVSVHVPTGYRWIVRDIAVGWNGAEAARITVSSSRGYIAVVELIASAYVRTNHWAGRVCLYPGERITASSVPDGTLVMITGYELIGGTPVQAEVLPADGLE